MTTLTVAPTASIAIESPPRAPLLTRFVERIAQLPRLRETSVDPVLARAIDEAFESFARESRT